MTSEKTAQLHCESLRQSTTANPPMKQDVLVLRSYLPNQPQLDPDEVACLVIQDAVEHNERIRTMRGQLAVSAALITYTIHAKTTHSSNAS
jgi:hypothetical protein